MIFTSFEFLLFFAVVASVRSCFRNFNRQKWVLLLASCIFYVTWNLPCLGLILFTSISDWTISRKMNGTTDPAARKRLLVLSLILNLGLLGFFKYSNFFLENIAAAVNNLGWRAGAWH